MGVSTNAYLFFGVDLGEELPESILKFQTDDSGEYEALEAFCDKMNEKYPGLDMGCDYHCHYDSPMYFLYLWKVVAWRGYPQQIDFRKLHVPVERFDLFEKVLAEAGIKATPDTMLASFWG